MELHFEAVTAENKETALSLNVASGQKGLVESVAQCLGEAEAYSVWKPVMIYDGGQAVGFAMYGFFAEEYKGGRVWLDRFFIDGRFQGHGYGDAALRGLIDRLQQEYGRREIFLSVVDKKIPAVKLYQKYGFRFNGERDINGEEVMILKG